MTKVYTITNVYWDFDDDDYDYDVNLPNEFDIKVDIPQGASREEEEDIISDKISDTYGFCHNGFTYTDL